MYASSTYELNIIIKIVFKTKSISLACTASYTDCVRGYGLATFIDPTDTTKISTLLATPFSDDSLVSALIFSSINYNGNIVYVSDYK